MRVGLPRNEHPGRLPDTGGALIVAGRRRRVKHASTTRLFAGLDWASKGLGRRYTGSGAKSDAGDAYLLADVLRTDGHRLSTLTQDSDATQVLRALSRTHKQLVEARVG